MAKNTEKSTRPSSAEYPVDPVERSNQEARLRKAAAAGASSSKSPIPGLMLQARPTAPAAQQITEAKATLPKPTTPTHTAPQTSDAPSASGTTNDQVLAELRKISTWADLQRKITKWSLVLVAIVVLVAIGGVLLMEQYLNKDAVTNVSPGQVDWYEVDRNVRLGDFQKAITMGEELILKTPQYPEAHQRLARAYLAAGNVDKAREHYAEAFRLFPCEENEKLLDAIEKRINADKP